MSDETNFCMQRIEKLFHELRYEIERGIMKRDIDETIGFEFVIPLSRAIPDGVIVCRFESRPRPRHEALMFSHSVQPRLRLVKGSPHTPADGGRG